MARNANNPNFKQQNAASVAQKRQYQQQKKAQAILDVKKKKAIKKANKDSVIDAILSSIGGLLTIISLLFGLYGIISIPAAYLCFRSIVKNKGYGWRGYLIPGICLVINILWIIAQVAFIVSPTLRVAFYDFLTRTIGVNSEVKFHF